MLKLIIPPMEHYDEEANEFIASKGQTLQLEHSLVSLSKWEAKWHRAFLARERKSLVETIDYIRCMTVTQHVDDSVYFALTDAHIQEVNDYIEAPMTATTISKQKTTTSRAIITAELIYYWMISFNIPFECQRWHLNRLLTLIDVCNIKNQSPKKMSKKELMARNAALNASRKKALRSNG